MLDHLHRDAHLRQQQIRPSPVCDLLARHSSWERHHPQNVAARDQAAGGRIGRRDHAQGCEIAPRQALIFVKTNGITLESGRGPVPSLAQTIAGMAIRGNWWAHPKGHAIFLCSRAIRESKDVLVCRLVGGKVTYVHRRLWPALVRLAEQFDAHRLAAIRDVHTATGKHKIEVTVFPGWVPSEIIRAAANLTGEQAAEMLGIDEVRPTRK